MGVNKIRYAVVFLVLLILVSTICLPVEAASTPTQNVTVTKLVDESNYKKTLYVITTSDDTYHIIVQANITVVGSETLIDLNATLYNPANETITASAQIPDTINKAPYYNGGYYNGPVQAWVLSLNSTQVFALEVKLVIVMVAAIIFQAIAIAAVLLIAPVVAALKTLFFGGPFIYASIPWVLLALLQDRNPDGSVTLYFPYAPASLVGNWITHEEYFVRSNSHWWKISEHEITFLWITLFEWYQADIYDTIGTPSPPPPPIAEFVWSPNQPFVNETVFFNSTSYAQQGATITTYQWGLGDNKTKNVPSFNYVYNNPGVYNVTLKVTDSNGNSSSVSHNVTVQAIVLNATLRVVPLDLEMSTQAGHSANASILAEETLNETDLTNVTFTASDLTCDYDNWTISSGNITFSRNEITITKGTYTNVTATFSAPLDSPIGWYSGNITATSNNGGNETIFATLLVYGPPTANFTWSPLIPKVGDVVTFDGSSSVPGGGSIVDYSWNFGDGNTMDTSTPIIYHAFSSLGTYIVTLNVTDSNNLWDAAQHQVQVTASQQPNNATTVGGTSVSLVTLSGSSRVLPLPVYFTIVTMLALVFTAIRRKKRCE